MQGTVRKRLFVILSIIGCIISSESFAKKPVLRDLTPNTVNYSGERFIETSNTPQAQQPISINYRTNVSHSMANVEESPFVSETAIGQSDASEETSASTDETSSVEQNNNRIWRKPHKSSSYSSYNNLDASYLPPSIYTAPTRTQMLQNRPGFRTLPNDQKNFGIRRTMVSSSSSDARGGQLARQSLSSRVVYGSKREDSVAERREIELKNGRTSLLRPFVSTDLFYSSAR